jgi:Txe/YoeB family toxin of Txe-Axe toxin-antitoxin module
MNVPFNFGFLASMHAALVTFEEFSKGKARTELILQSMKDGDTIFVFGSGEMGEIEARLRRLNKTNCLVRYFRESDFTHPGDFEELVKMAPRRWGTRVHLDHSIVFRLMERGLVEMNHEFARIVSLVGITNEQSAEDERLYQGMHRAVRYFPGNEVF